MKNWVKYLIDKVFFGIVYALMDYLFSKSIDWESVIVATIVYGVLNVVVSKIANKFTNKK